MDDLKDRRGYCQLKEEALDRTMWRNRFGRGFGPVIWQITDDDADDDDVSIEVTRRRGRRRKKLMDDLKDRRGYCQLKEEALDRTMWRNRFGRVFGPVVWQITEDECIYIYMMWNRSRIILHKVRNVLWSFLVSINKYTILLRVLRVLKFKLSNKTKPTQGMFQSTCLRKW